VMAPAVRARTYATTARGRAVVAGGSWGPAAGGGSVLLRANKAELILATLPLPQNPLPIPLDVRAADGRQRDDEQNRTGEPTLYRKTHHSVRAPSPRRDVERLSHLATR
jgi:hypothetical protein